MNSISATVLVLTIIVFLLSSLIPGDLALAILSDGEGSYTQRDWRTATSELRHHGEPMVTEIGSPSNRAPFWDLEEQMEVPWPSTGELQVTLDEIRIFKNWLTMHQAKFFSFQRLRKSDGEIAGLIAWIDAFEVEVDLVAEEVVRLHDQLLETKAVLTGE